MLTCMQLKQSQLDQLYDWIDGLPLSKPKKNISRDFSDAILMAQIVQKFYPKLIQIHNYPAGNSYKLKISNWMTLNNKVLNRLGICLTNQDCQRLANAAPLAIQSILYQLKKLIDDSIMQYPQQPQSSNKRTSSDQPNQPMSKTNALSVSRVQQLRQIYSLIKQKISIVEKSLQRKDGQIRELQEILKEGQA